MFSGDRHSCRRADVPGQAGTAAVAYVLKLHVVPVRSLQRADTCGRVVEISVGCSRRVVALSGFVGVYRHRITFVKGRKESASELLPRVHQVISLLKRWLLGTHQGAVSRARLDWSRWIFVSWNVCSLMRGSFRLLGFKKDEHRPDVFCRLDLTIIGTFGKFEGSQVATHRQISRDQGTLPTQINWYVHCSLAVNSDLVEAFISPGHVDPIGTR